MSYDAKCKYSLKCKMFCIWKPFVTVTCAQITAYVFVMFSTWRFISWFASWVSPACDWPVRPWPQSSSTKGRWWESWRGLRCTFYTTNQCRNWRRSCHQPKRRCRCPGYWTSCRWTSNLGLPESSERCRRLRCTRPPSVGTYQPHHWWRTSSIQPSTTDQYHAGSAYYISN